MLWFIPHIYAQWGLVGMNMLQHDGTDQDHPYNHSRNFVGKAVNWWAYNNGYHGLHHIQPGLHWSLLPEKHAELVAPHIHPNLDQKSLVAYCFRAFILNKREDYLGNPIVLPEEGPDEEWIPDPRSDGERPRRGGDRSEPSPARKACAARRSTRAAPARRGARDAKKTPFGARYPWARDFPLARGVHTVGA